MQQFLKLKQSCGEEAPKSNNICALHFRRKKKKKRQKIYHDALFLFPGIARSEGMTGWSEGSGYARKKEGWIATRFLVIKVLFRRRCVRKDTNCDSFVICELLGRRADQKSLAAIVLAWIWRVRQLSSILNPIQQWTGACCYSTLALCELHFRTSACRSSWRWHRDLEDQY